MPAPLCEPRSNGGSAVPDDQLDETFDPLPALSDPPDPDEELTLQDALAEPATADPADTTGPPAPLGRAPAFDFIAHRFLPGTAGGPLQTRGVDTLRTWVEKAARTKRGQFPAVDPDFGTDITAEDLLSEGDPFDPSAISEYLDAVRRGLLVHPRITDVTDMQIIGSLDDDEASVAFTVVTDTTDLRDLDIRLPLT
jgi:hypothetical protein